MIQRKGKHYLIHADRLDSKLRTTTYLHLRLFGLGLSVNIVDLQRYTGRPGSDDKYRKRAVKVETWAHPEGTGGRSLAVNFTGKRRPQ